MTLVLNIDVPPLYSRASLTREQIERWKSSSFSWSLSYEEIKKCMPINLHKVDTFSLHFLVQILKQGSVTKYIEII